MCFCKFLNVCQQKKYLYPLQIILFKIVPIIVKQWRDEEGVQKNQCCDPKDPALLTQACTILSLRKGSQAQLLTFTSKGVNQLRIVWKWLNVYCNIALHMTTVAAVLTDVAAPQSLLEVYVLIYAKLSQCSMAPGGFRCVQGVAVVMYQHVHFLKNRDLFSTIVRAVAFYAQKGWFRHFICASSFKCT